MKVQCCLPHNDTPSHVDDELYGKGREELKQRKRKAVTKTDQYNFEF